MANLLDLKNRLRDFFSPIAQTANNIHQTWDRGVQNIKQSNPVSYTPFAMKSEIVPSMHILGQATGYKQPAEDIGYGLRGALSITPFQAVKPMQQQYKLQQQSNPTTFRQQAAQSVGQGVYGSALTSPIAGGVLPIVRNAIMGTGLGVGMGVGSDLISGQGLPNKQRLTEHALSGFQNSWTLPITNAITSKLLSGVAPNLVGSKITEPFKNGQVKQGFIRLFTRALAESPLENTVFTELNRMDDKSKQSFMEDWLANIPGNVLSNLAFAGASGAWNTTVNKESRDAVGQALVQTWKKAQTPVNTMEIDASGKRITVPMWRYELEKKFPIGGTVKNINELSPEDYAKLKPTQPTKGVGGETQTLIKKYGTIKPEQLRVEKQAFIDADGNIIKTGGVHEKALGDLGYVGEREKILPKFLKNNNTIRVVAGGERYPGINIQSNAPLTSKQIDSILKASPNKGSVFMDSPAGQMDFQYANKNELLQRLSPTQPTKGVEVNTTGQSTNIQGNKNMVLEQGKAPILQTQLPETNISSRTETSTPILALPKPKYEVSTSTQMKKILAKDPTADVRIVLKPSGKQFNMADGPIPTRDEVGATIPNRINNFVEEVAGYSTTTPTGGNRKAGIYTRLLRTGQEKITTAVESGLGSDNALIRNSASTIQNFFRGLGMSPERATASMELRGEMGVANQRAFDVMDSLYKTLGENKGSLERINAVLDPELAKVKVKFDELTPVEQSTYKLIREGLDLVHDTSYANGHISEELYIKNKGSYTPRLYDVMEMPPEVNKFVTQGKKIVNDLYKQRKDIDQWKLENSLNDPVYALGKRLAQVETNTAIKKYTDFLSNNPRFISDVERPGFTKLSDSPAYGALSGKFVLNSAAEDLKGFFFSNTAVQNLYDVFRSYDRLGIRQLQKKLLTVFNPTTNVGNIVSDQVFGLMTGVDPLTLNKNLLDFKANPAKYKQAVDYLTSKGIVGTDITRTDFVNKLGSIDDLALGKKPSKIKIATNKVQAFYGGTDDIYKASAFKALLDKGFTLEEATRKVADGFQNYANVGKFYDVWAKTPVVGSAFVKFQGDLIRMIKNAVVNNPLTLVGFLGALKGVSYLSSKASGETDEDRKTRETIFAAPMIPGLNIPLTWQTPWGEINAARYISPFYANNETTNVSKMFPFMPRIDTKKDVATNIAQNVNDPLLSTPVQLLVNRDFRGKPISDPKENKYQPSTLLPGEKLINQLKFAGRAYTPPPVNSAIDVVAAAQGKPNMYGTPQTVPQAVARLGGIKISNYGPEEVQKIRENDMQFQQYANDAIDTQVNSVTKQQLKGEITPEQAKARIENLKSKKKEITLNGTTGANTTTGEFAYLNKSGDLKKVAPITNPTTQFYITDPDTGNKKFVDVSIPITKPELTGNETMDKLALSTYKSDLNARIKEIYLLATQGTITQDQAISEIDKLQKQYDSTKKAKKAPKITIKAIKAPKIKITTSKIGKIKMGKIKMAKLKPIKVKNIKMAAMKAVKFKSPKIRIA